MTFSEVLESMVGKTVVSTRETDTGFELTLDTGETVRVYTSFEDLDLHLELV